jgi:hypothetical protein
LIDEYVALLRDAISYLWPRLEVRRSRFQVRLSHDIDWPAHPAAGPVASAKAIGGDVLRRRDIGLARARIQARVARRRSTPQEDPYNTFAWIMQQSEATGLASAFYFMTARTDERFDAGYQLDQPWLLDTMRQIHARGHELGLHPSYGSFQDAAQIRREYERLVETCGRIGITQDAWGGRQHFLRWENPVTWRAWAQSGLTYDSSLGYANRVGFRCGVCHEYPTFDLLERRPLGLRERPLLVMDMAVLEAPTLAGVETVIRHCRRFGGELTLLWHNSQLVSRRQRAVYQEVLSLALRNPATPG